MNFISTCAISKARSYNNTVWECVIPYIQEPQDRAAISLVCKSWYEIDAITRKHITIALCYTTTADLLLRRFPHLESLKLKGQPRAVMFSLVPNEWGGYVTPWIKEIVESSSRIKALHFRRMIVKDSDLELLATSETGKGLEVLKLDYCRGFSTDGLLHISRFCRSIKTLFMEECTILENDGEWLHELALKNTVLENLNFYLTDLVKISSEDLELIARKCASLVSMKISDCDTSDLCGFFQSATSLEEFGGGSFSALPEQVDEGVLNEQLKRYSIAFPPRLCRLGLTFLGKTEMPIVFSIASRLRKLDLLYAMLDTEGHCLLLQRCPNLEILAARIVIGDRGLEVLAQFCKRMKRLKFERGDENEEAEGVISHKGLIALSRGCIELEHLSLYVSDITNASLKCVGTYLKNLQNFRLVLIEKQEKFADFPLDNGVRSLLMGCHKLRRFALCLRPGGLTDVGLSYIGRYSPKVRWMLLHYVGESDKGILEFSKGCPSLRKLEMSACCFSERALAVAVLRLTSLRYLWVTNYRITASGGNLIHMVRPNWITELIPATQAPVHNVKGEVLAHILAYYSLAGQRTDLPSTMRHLILNI
ncbi:coronatine-insensitive protein 1-like [Olea europaea var. sylvestris]|uniref:coronatine-insensitive protein 1-like n=1 Tax=Olea europaea var. sylvestris TaxID=158386 RepID=UPI000C1CD987|nr:coronatine-insensitive protein 1-like [Olea europaea var. sylvestris]